MTHRFVSAREIVGKTIVGLDPGDIHRSRYGGTLHYAPAIVLDDGSRLFFITQEDPDGSSDYAIFIGRTTPTRRTK